MLRFWRRFALALIISISVLALAFIAALYASRPQLSGMVHLAGLTQPVTVHRDAIGHTTLEADSRHDLAHAAGFIHAQERFMSMDLRRRLASGEMAALLGPAVVRFDKENRPHRFREHAKRVVATLSAPERALMQAYVDGVNAGLQALPIQPFPYFLLFESPQPWTLEDCILSAYSIHLLLQGGRWRYEVIVDGLHEAFGAEVANFLAPIGTHYDAPLDDTPIPLLVANIPGSDAIDLRNTRIDSGKLEDVRMHWERSGSNAFAVGGRLTPHGSGLMANDMHLVLLAPNIWYRMHWRWGEDREHMASGVTLPGLPWMLAGSNGHIAWGYTNSNVDSQDLITLERDEPSLRTIEEPLEIRFGRDHTLTYRYSHWGPVVSKDIHGQERALRWSAHWLTGDQFNLSLIEQAKDLETALRVFQQSGIPPQNVLVTDRQGNLGWTIGGPLFVREDHNGRIPMPSSAYAPAPQWLSPDRYPRIVNHPDHRLWSANSRHVGGEDFWRLGDGRYTGGMRAQQIRNRLYEKEVFDEVDLLAIQLDIRADYLEEWFSRIQRILDEPEIAPLVEQHGVREILAQWDHQAHPDSVAYRLLRTFRKRSHELFLLTLHNRLVDFPLNDTRALRWQLDGPLRRILDEEAVHFLPQNTPRTNDFLVLALRVTLEEMTTDGQPLAQATWGEVNRSQIRHPLSHVLFFLRPLLDPSSIPLPGDLNVPLVARPAFGASQRTVVAPGYEALGVMHMPAGQSGHPLSPFYNAGHEDWLHGRPAPFLPGPTQELLTLVPSEH